MLPHTELTTPTHEKHNNILVQRPAYRPHGGVRNPKPPRTFWQFHMTPAVQESTGDHTNQRGAHTHTHTHTHTAGETRKAAARKALMTGGYAATQNQPQHHTRNITNY